MKFVLAGYFGFGNFGDEAILKYAVDILRYYYKEAQISVISQNPDKIAEEYKLKSIHRFDLKEIIFEIKNCDCLIFPGGSILQDVTSIKSILYYLTIIGLGIFFKKEVIMLSQGIGPIKNSLAQNITKKLLKKISFISVRDENSYKILKQYDISSELTAVLLWAFTQKTDSSEKEETIIYGDVPCATEKQKVGLQLRSWADLTEEKLQIIANNILKLFPKLEFDYKLICLQESSDKELLIKLGMIMHEMQPEARVELLIPNTIDETIEICKELGLEYVDIKDFSEDEFREKIAWLKEFNPVKTALKTNIFVKKSQQNVDFLIREVDKCV